MFVMLRIPAPRPQSFELAKWIAVITMIIDHYGKIVDQDVLIWTHWIGRAAFPLFFWIIASRLADRPNATMGYVRSLLPWALVSQAVVMFAGRDWYELNIMFILLLGVLAVRVIHELENRPLQSVLLVVLCAVAVTSDFGAAGVASIPIVWMAAYRNHYVALAALAVMGPVVNLPASSVNDWISVAAALSAVVTAALSLYLAELRLPRMPKVAFYAIYPAHILVFALMASYL